MPHYNASTRLALMGTNLGIRVDRTTATLPQTANGALFNIVGGRVAMTAILGEVTVQLGAVGNLSLESNPTTGTAKALDTVVASNVNEVGALFSITGVVGDAALLSTAGEVALQDRPVALSVGALELKTSASAAGEMKWSMWYIPLDDGAYVTAA
jgi:hypothetical protein